MAKEPTTEQIVMALTVKAHLDYNNLSFTDLFVIQKVITELFPDHLEFLLLEVDYA
jgi:hypothetical protein